MNNAERVRLAQETLEILQRGSYQVGKKQIDLPDIEPMCSKTQIFIPDDSELLQEALQKAQGQYQTQVKVTGETTFQAARRINQEIGECTALNFASAKKPGGGFLTGAKSQEEDLTRCSGLYLALTQPQTEAYYLANRACGTSLYTDHLIYSPQVPVFRDEEAQLLPQPALVNVITAPAPNAGAVIQNEPQRSQEIQSVLRHRAQLILGIAAQMKQTHLILGAWGCGVFKNEPQQVATIFQELLSNEAQGVFKQVVFAILDRSQEQATLQSFQDILG